VKVILFGGSGFLGRAVTRALAAHGHTVESIARRSSAGAHVADVTDAAGLAHLQVDGDVAINLAARIPTSGNTLPGHESMFAVNAVGAANVAQWVAARGIKRLVHCSTLVVASRPWPVPLTEDAATYPTGAVAAYAASKLAGELVAGSIAGAAGIPFVTLRLATLYGPGMVWAGVLPVFIEAALSGNRLTASRGAHADFLHVGDAALAVVQAAGADVTGAVNVASGVETSIVELARMVLTACGRSGEDVDVMPSPVFRAVVDVTRMRERLGVQSQVPLSDGIDELVRDRSSKAAP
jgi:UDP-glucose 4-epimerase